ALGGRGHCRIAHRHAYVPVQPVADGDRHLVITCTVRSVAVPATRSTPTVSPCPSGTVHVGTTVADGATSVSCSTWRAVCVPVARSTVYTVTSTCPPASTVAAARTCVTVCSLPSRLATTCGDMRVSTSDCVQINGCALDVYSPPES